MTTEGTEEVKTSEGTEGEANEDMAGAEGTEEGTEENAA